MHAVRNRLPRCFGALDLSLSTRRILPAWALATATLTIFLAVVGLARAAGYWHTPVSDARYRDLIPRAADRTPKIDAKSTPMKAPRHA